MGVRKMLTDPMSYLNGTKAGREDVHWTHKHDGDPTANEKSRTPH